MKRLMIATVLLILPTLVSADYDPDKIKASIDQADDIFHIEKWKLSDVGNVWIAKIVRKGTGFVLSIGPKEAWILTGANTRLESIAAITQCWTLGHIGVLAKTKEEKDSVFDAVIKTTQVPENKTSIELNSVLFEVSVMNIAGNVFLSCHLKPAP